MEEKQDKQNVTIKDALKADKLYLDEVKTALNCSAAAALTHVLAQAKEADILKKNITKTYVNSEETESKLKETNTLLEVANDEIERLLKENEELKNRKPEKETVTEQIFTEVEKPLSDYQFICDLGEDLSKEARRLRKFIKENNYKKFNSFEVPETETPENYVSRLTKFAVKKLLTDFKNDYL